MIMTPRLIPALRRVCLVVLLAVAFTGCKSSPNKQQRASVADWLKTWQEDNRVWRGVHVMVLTDKDAVALTEALPKLSDQGVNVVIAEINYSFQFHAHPELRTAQYVTVSRARLLASKARELGIRIIPQFNCLGHQSWGTNTAPLLARYPQFDETPGQYPENKDIYCRSWCPQHPEVNNVVFSLIDELIDAFSADAFHVGMDEVFFVGSQYCERCRGGDPAKLFARAVNDLHEHLVKKRKVEMLMWGDRLLDSNAMGYSEWESSKNRTHGALRMIPKDIIICDWHYTKRTTYPSIPFLLEKGFRVWPSGWQPLDDSLVLSEYARKQKHPRLLGYLVTTWGKVRPEDLAQWPPLLEPLRQWN